MLQPIRSIDTRRLFLPLARKLIALLRSLTPEQWLAPTCYPRWKVKDIASHLLQTGVSRLSGQRDGFKPGKAGGPVAPDFASIAGLIADNNAAWEKASASWSPRLIIELLSVTEPALARFFRTLDPHAPAFYSVAWAGETESENWFDVGREYTERWHHQEQIREAVRARRLDGPRRLAPVIDLLLRAAPFWYAGADAAPGVEVALRVTGNSGGDWTLRRETDGWRLYRGAASGPPAAAVTLSADTAWRLLTRSLPRDRAEPLIRFQGDPGLARRFLDVKAIMLED